MQELPLTTDRLRTVVIENVYPELNGGRHPIKREVGDTLEVWADIFAEGHDVLAAVLKYRVRGAAEWTEVPMTYFDNDRWRGSFTVERNDRYHYTIEAYRAVWEFWRRNLTKKHEAGEDVSSELLEGRRLVEEARGRAQGAEDRTLLGDAARRVGAAKRPVDQIEVLLDSELQAAMARNANRSLSTQYKLLDVIVDRVAARFAAWYELFPRSQGTDPKRGSTFREAAARLRAVRAMGFDVVYLPPIHPIGISHRKGPNNTLVAKPGDPGSPWAIGNVEGGHTAVHPDLGTIEDFDWFVEQAREQELEVALDFALQCSPDHPWVKEHPDWFYRRPDGSIRYAENPPKKYQDIYPINFYSSDWQALWRALRDVLLYWAQHGVRTFRVDNPHTKPFAFWEWAIAEVQRTYPDTAFLSEAFTRPKVLKYLAKAGFSQSYTYFTWRTEKQELTEFATELTQWEPKEYLRGNFFANTPDILPEILQKGGRPAFKQRLALAATLSSVYGIYSGFELCEFEPVPGTEEYLNSEKYQVRVRDWDVPGNIVDYVTAINRIRRENPALQEYENLRFFPADHDKVLFYGKATADNSNAVFVAVNLDPYAPHTAKVELPLREFGIGPKQPYQVCDLLSGETLTWRGETQTLTLDPEAEPARLFSLVKRASTRTPAAAATATPG